MGFERFWGLEGLGRKGARGIEVDSKDQLGLPEVGGVGAQLTNSMTPAYLKRRNIVLKLQWASFVKVASCIEKVGVSA